MAHPLKGDLNANFAQGGRDPPQLARQRTRSMRPRPELIPSVFACMARVN